MMKTVTPISQVMVVAGVEAFNGFYYNPKTDTSIYVTNNICIKCRLKYPKNHNICVICKKILRKTPKNKKNWWNNQ